MKAYVDLVQSKERKLDCDLLTHQKWSGAMYIDSVLQAIQSGTSATASLGADSTEHSMKEI
jgi:isocitrate lyase